MLSPKPVSENEAPISTDGGSHSNSESCINLSEQQTCSKSVPPAKKIQVRIVRDVPRSAATSARRQRPCRPGDGSLIRMTVDVGPVSVPLPRGAKHHYKTLDEQSDPAPLQFAADAGKRLVPEQECRQHYIHFSKKGSVVTKTWICGICGKTCPKQFNLMRHLLVDHLNVRSFTCDQCPKAFKTKLVLNQHVRSSHCAVNPYVCAVCQKRFSRVSVLIQHQRLHSDEKSFSCHCGKAFHQKVNLTMHQQRLHRPSSEQYGSSEQRGRQPPQLVYNCLACSAQLASVQLLLDHKLTCQPLLDSLGRSIKVNPDTEKRLDAGKKRNINDKLLSKIQSIVQQQEQMRRRQAAAPPPRPAASRPDPRRLQGLLMAAGRTARPAAPRPQPTQPPPEYRIPAQTQVVTQPRQPQQPQQLPVPQPTAPQQPPAPQQQQQQQLQPPAPQQQPSQPRAGKMMGVLTAPIRTRSMQLAREKNLQPFVLLQTDGEEATLAKVLQTTESLELLVPATTDDLRQLHQQQAVHRNSEKVDLPVVAIVTHFYDENGAPHVRVQPPSSELGGSDCTELFTSQIDMGPTRGAPQPAAVAAEPVSDPEQLLPSAVMGGGRQDSPSPAAAAETAAPGEQGLSMPSGDELLATASPAPRPASADLVPTRDPVSVPPAGPLLASAGPLLVSAGSPLVSAGPLLSSAGPLLVSAGPLLSSAESPLVSAGPLLALAGSPLVSEGSPLVSAGSPLVSAGSLLASAGSPLVSGGPLLASAGSPLVSGGPPLVSAGSLLVSGDLLSAASAELLSVESPVYTPPDRLPAGGTLMSAGTNVLPAGTTVLPAGISLLSDGGDTMVQFVRQTTAGELEPVSVADAALLFSQPGTSYQILSGAGPPTVTAAEEVPGTAQ